MERGDCDHLFTTRLNRLRTGHGRPECAEGCSDMTKPPLLSVVLTEDLEVHKVGITGEGTEGIVEHARFGWGCFAYGGSKLAPSLGPSSRPSCAGGEVNAKCRGIR